MSGVFTPSNLTKATSQVETWRKLAQSMIPSRGPGSGGLKPNAPANGTQWLRKVSFSLFQNVDQQKEGDFPGATGAGKSNKGRELSQLRITFNIKHQQAGTPATLWARVYNMSPDTMAKVIQFGKVQVKAGYEYAAYGLVFEGKVIQYRRGKENPTDTYLEVHASDGDDRINRAVLLETFPEGSTDKTILDQAIKELGYEKNKVVTKNLIEDLEKEITLRSNTKLIPVRDQLRELMNKHNATYFFQHGKIVVMKRDETLTEKAVVLSPKTGLIGLPQVTPQGIQAQCLLNPNIKVGSKVKIETAILSGVPFTPGTQVTVDKNNQIQGSPAGGIKREWGTSLETAWTSPTGTYKVVFLEHQGDTRGDAWYCNMTCVALDDKGVVMVGANPSSALKRGSAEAQAG